MIVPRAEIDLILSATRLRRRVLRSPRHLPPLRVGHAYRLQERSFSKARATITCTNVETGILDNLTLADARREGYARIEEAIAAWTAWFGQPRQGEPVWVTTFTLGDLSHLYDQPVFLTGRAKDGGASSNYTLRPGLALREDGKPIEVEPARPGAAERARILALAQRQAPVAAVIRQSIANAVTLREAMVSMKARNRAALIARELEKLEGELPVRGGTIPA